MTYLTIELLIIATGIIIFAISFCGFLQKWMQYVADLDETKAGSSSKKKDVEKGNLRTTPSMKCVLHENCAVNYAFEKDKTPTYTSTDLPPKYEEVVHTDGVNQTSRKNEQILQVQQLPQVHCIYVSKQSAKSNENVQHV